MGDGFGELAKRTALRAALAAVATGLLAWALSGFDRPWAEISAAAGVVAIVIVARALLAEPDQPDR